MKHTLFTDGGSRGNPGNSASGVFLFDEDNKVVDFGGEYLGKATNNQAEYLALIEGLKVAKKNKVKDLVVFMDSELIIMQVNGAYRVKNKDLKTLFEQVKDLKESFETIKFAHVRREKNKLADQMVNIILDTIEK